MKKLSKKQYIILIIIMIVIAVIGRVIIFMISTNEKNKNGEGIFNMTQSDKAEPYYEYGNKNVAFIYPFERPAYYADLIAMLKHDVGVLAQGIDWADVASYLNTVPLDLLILPDAETIPFGASQAIGKYLKNGGNLLTLGGPPLSKTFSIPRLYFQQSELKKEAPVPPYGVDVLSHR